MSKPLKEDNDNTGIFQNMEMNSHNHEPSIRYPCSNNPLDNKQNEQYSQKTEINNIIETKKNNITVIHTLNVNNNSKVNSNLDFDFLSESNINPNSLLNKKTKRDGNNNEINEEGINQIQTNKRKNYGKNNFIKNGNELRDKDYFMNFALKLFFKLLIKLIEDIGNIKFEKLNLNDIFTDMEINKLILDLPLYKIICFEGYEKNKEILENAKPIGEKNKKLFEYILAKKFIILLHKYYYNSKIFDINGTIIKAQNFKTIDEVLFEAKFKNISLDEQSKISNIKTMTKIILDDFNHEEKKDFNFNSICIERFDKYVDNNESIQIEEIDDFNYTELNKDNYDSIIPESEEESDQDEQGGEDEHDEEDEEDEEDEDLISNNFYPYIHRERCVPF